MFLTSSYLKIETIRKLTAKIKKSWIEAMRIFLIHEKTKSAVLPALAIKIDFWATERMSNGTLCYILREYLHHQTTM